VSVQASTLSGNSGSLDNRPIVGMKGYQGSISGAYSYEIAEKFAKLEYRIDILETYMKMVPSVVGEAVIEALQEVANTGNYGEASLSKTPVNTAHGHSTGFNTDNSMFIFALCNNLANNIKSKINFDEINKLRDRVRQLEEDLGYREKVAKELMKDYK
jgi:hypothetical protein